MEQNKVFRQAALDRLASPEQLDTLMRVTDAKGWLALLGGALILCTAVIWGTLGTMRTKIAVNGILLSGNALTEVTARGDGMVTSIEVKAGDSIKKGQLVARVSQPALSEQIESVKTQINEFSQGFDGGPPSPFRVERRLRLEKDLDRLQKQFKVGETIVSNLDGRVIEVRTLEGARVEEGSPIAAIEPEGGHGELEALLYVDSFQGKTLRPGMTIELVPSVVRKERHGAMIGRVKSVDDFPSTRLGMMGDLKNEQLVDSFLQAAGGTPIAVRAELITDPKTPSGYRWSSGRGPKVVLTPGTRCVGAVVTRTQRPIALVFPALDEGS